MVGGLPGLWLGLASLGQEATNLVMSFESLDLLAREVFGILV